MAPELFAQSDRDGIAVVLQDEVPVSDIANVEEAADICPVGAILLARTIVPDGPTS